MSKHTTKEYVWFTATLATCAKGLFTNSFYPEGKDSVVYFTQVDITPNVSKVIVATKMVESHVRIMTLELAKNCLVPGEKANDSDSLVLNELVKKLKV